MLTSLANLYRYRRNRPSLALLCKGRPVSGALRSAAVLLILIIVLTILLILIVLVVLIFLVVLVVLILVVLVLIVLVLIVLVLIILIVHDGTLLKKSFFSS